MAVVSLFMIPSTRWSSNGKITGRTSSTNYTAVYVDSVDLYSRIQKRQQVTPNYQSIVHTDHSLVQTRIYIIALWFTARSGTLGSPVTVSWVKHKLNAAEIAGEYLRRWRQSWCLSAVETQNRRLQGRCYTEDHNDNKACCASESTKPLNSRQLIFKITQWSNHPHLIENQVSGLVKTHKKIFLGDRRVPSMLDIQSRNE